MAITLVNAQTAGTAAAATTITVNKPTGVAVGDLMLWSIGSSTASPAAPALVAGWTSNTAWFNTGTSPNAGVLLWYRIVDGTEAASFTRNTLTSGRWSSFIVAYRGVDRSNPFDATSLTVNNDGAQPTHSAITTVTPGALVLGIEDVSTASGVTTTVYTSSNLAIDATISSTAAAATNALLGIGSLTQATPGSVTPVMTPSGSPTRGDAISAALRPLVVRPSILITNPAVTRAATR